MIAAGSLFTSCVENTEPQGIRDLREAKADYLASLSKLREADAEKVKAEAAYEQAKAEVKQAQAAFVQAKVEAQQILNEASKVENEVAAAKAKAAIDSIKAKAEQDAVKAQKDLAEKKAELDSTLRNIAAAAIGLTGGEKKAISEKTLALNTAYNNYNWSLADYNTFAFLLWDAEYNVAVGVKGYETAQSFKDTIADRQAQIAELEADIASYEALKAEPAGIKDTLDAIAEEITALDAEITTKENVKKLYEASVPFKDAKDEYTKRWDKFKEDSLPGATFEFVDVDEDGQKVNKRYAMNTVYNYNPNFVDDVVWMISLIPTEDPSHFYGNPYVVADIYGNDIEGKSSFSFTRRDKEGVENALYGFKFKNEDYETDVLGLKGIVSALKRELVIVNNPEDSAIVAEKAKAAHDADSTYKADRKILEIGFEKSTFVEEAKDSLAKLATDTVAEKGKYTAAVEDLKTKQGDEKTKKDAQIAAVRTAAAAYNAAVDAMATAVRAYNEEADSTAFINAIKAFGIAKATFNGRQDSLSYTTYDPYTAKQKTSKDAFSEVNPSYFKKGTDHPVYKETFLDVVKTVFGNGASFETKKKELIAGLAYNPLKDATDSIAVLKDKNLAVKAAVTDYEAAKKATVRANVVKDSLNTVFDTKVDKYNTYKDASEGEAKAEYAKIFNKFWGYSETHELVADDYKPYKFPWTDKTFEDPFTCVAFLGNNILGGATFDVIMRGLDNYSFQFNVDPDEIDIFRNQETNKLTEYATKLQTAQFYDIAKNYIEYEDQLANIEAAVNKAEEEFLAYCAEYEAATEGQEEILARFRGVDEDGELLPAVRVLTDASIVEGKWALGGYQLAWAEELAPEYPEIVKNAVDAIKPLQTRKGYLETFKAVLDQVYTTWWNKFEKESEEDRQADVEAIVGFFETQITKCENSIISLQKEIAEWEKAVAACEAGYSPAQVKVDALKAVLEIKKVALAQAEEALARAKKEYEEVIAKYGVRDAE